MVIGRTAYLSIDRNTLLFGGTILTMNAQNAVASSMLIKNNRIHKIWSGEINAADVPANTQKIDLKGQTLVPGIIDAHGHFPGEGLGAVALDLNSPPIGKIKAITDIIQGLKASVLETKKGEWIRGFGFDDTMIFEKRHITRQELDEVSNEHPIFIFHISGHMAVVNSFALSMLGISESSIAPEGGEYHKDTRGNLSGLLIETAHYGAKKLAFKFAPLQSWSIVQKATDSYLKQGVTTAQNGLLESSHYNIMSWLAKLGLYDIRLVLWPSANTQKQIISGELAASKLDDTWFKMGAVKLVADGSIQGYTGYLSHPYHTHPNELSEDYRGFPLKSKQKLIEDVAYFYERGFQLAIHANGDAAIDDVIEAVAQAQSKYPKKDTRTVLVHSQMVRQDQLNQFKKLSITPSYFNAHVYYWGERHKILFLGETRAEAISPMKSTQKLGIPFSLHSDSPVVPMTPWLNAWNAVTRTTYQGEVLGAHERIDAQTALRSITIDAAWQQFIENDRGSLEQGKLADFVVLEKNPLSSQAALKDPCIVSTWLGGVRVYERINKI